MNSRLIYKSSSITRRLFSKKQSASRFADFISPNANSRKTTKFPVLTLILTGGTIYIFSQYSKLNYYQVKQHFIVSQMNLLKNHRYESIILNPISFEHQFYFYLNVPAIAIGAYLLETRFKTTRLLALVLGNAILSAATTIIWDRQFGYKKKRQRGSISNNNGNLGLFLLCAFACKKPSHMLLNGKTILTKIPFIFLPMIFIMVYFQKFNDEKSKVTARNFNETHIAAVFNALFLTLFI